MKVSSVSVKEVSKNKVKGETNIHLDVHNGFNRVNLSISGQDISIKELQNYMDYLDKINVKGVFYARNCCKNSPIVILDSNNKEDTKEIDELIKDILVLVGEDIKLELEKI